MRRILVVGASLAGVSAAEELRAQGYEGELVLVGAEPHLPYTRPPLSKDALLEGIDQTALQLRDEHWYAERGIELRLGEKAVGLDTTHRQLRLADEATLDYDGLVLTTGLAHRPLPPALRLRHAHQLRTLDEAERLSAALAGARHLVVVGAGFVGLETAATARLLGLDVTVLDVAAQPMSKAFGPEIGIWFARRHELAGVRLLLSASIIRADDEPDGTTTIALDSGERLRADCCLVGTGSMPTTDWLRGSGIDLGDGVLCDPTLATNVPDVVAAGDIARWDNEQFGESMRVEHWTNAVEQGVHAAGRLLGSRDPFTSVPFFWTDQFDAKLRCVGRPSIADDVDILRDEDARLVAAFSRGGRIRGAVCVNAPREMAQLRRAIAERTRVSDLTRDCTPATPTAAAAATA
ncbi:NAD(P)/FAD-dependent oxidoreductase [Nocardioides sp. LS1]|uniref:NAD(P)/FAD-dependent oxidoreductase n=1 Tax=Nocardioides sp. LS1 TaxID=1027620 RepID=UPI000F619E60|nr:FAD-dependent oxidoreductase [Nocardioides sp. LS1]GCD91192.1 ferredoxin reductase [Nocardioides sp. LS1]